MSDLERRLRATVVRRSEGFEPSDDLVDHITARVRRRHVQRRALAAGLVATAAAVLVVAGFVVTGGDESGSIRMSGQDPVVTPSPTSAPPSTTTAPGSTTSTTTGSSTTTSSTAPTSSTLPAPPTGPAIDVTTSLNRQGFGPIAAGMTLRQAQEAGGVTLVPSASDGSCFEARLQGFDPSPVLIVEPAGADPMDGIVRAVQGSVLPSEEGAIVGQSRAELLAALGTPTRTGSGSVTWGPDAELLVFESGGYAYAAVVVDDMVLGLQSGDPAWVSADEGCPR